MIHEKPEQTVGNRSMVLWMFQEYSTRSNEWKERNISGFFLLSNPSLVFIEIIFPVEKGKTI
jgi:hypothetical protein